MTFRARGWGVGRSLIVVLAIGSAGLHAQWASDVEGIHKFRLRASEGNLQLNVEAQSDERTNRGEPVRRDYVFVEPVVGLDLRGSIYHPNLLEFFFKPELGLSTQVVKWDPPGGVKWSEKWLQRYDARVNVLREKPFASHFFAERGRTYRNLDFFSRARVDSMRYGGHTGYSTGKIPFAFDLLHMAETATGGSGRATDVSGNTFSFSASHAEKKTHKTNFSYLLNSYHRLEEGLAPISGTAHNANLTDTISWGDHDWVSLNSAALFNALNSSVSHTRGLIVQENLALQFRPTLAGEGHYDFGDQHSDQVSSRSHEARASVRHQLYQSLTSTFTAQAASLASHSRETTLQSDRFGVAAAEHYAKRLPARSLLSLSASWHGDRHQRQASGQILYIADESIRLSDRQPAFLSQPSIIEVGRVTNSLGIVYAETLDYILVPHGNLMEIRRVPGGNIPEGGQVLVNYTAHTQPNDHYSTVMEFYQVRLDMFNGLFALYARLNQVSNFGGKSVVLRDLDDRVTGAEFLWRWLVVGAERELVDSNLSPFQSKRIYESCVLDFGPGSTLTLDFDQGWTLFTDTGRTRKSRSFIGRYRKQIGTFFSFQAEGGVRRERGEGIDQDRKAARVALSYTYGKLQFNVSYDFEDEDLLGELHRRRQVILRARRTF